MYCRFSQRRHELFGVWLRRHYPCPDHCFVGSLVLLRAVDCVCRSHCSDYLPRPTLGEVQGRTGIRIARSNFQLYHWLGTHRSATVIYSHVYSMVGNSGAVLCSFDLPISGVAIIIKVLLPVAANNNQRALFWRRFLRSSPRRLWRLQFDIPHHEGKQPHVIPPFQRAVLNGKRGRVVTPLKKIQQQFLKFRVFGKVLIGVFAFQTGEQDVREKSSPPQPPNWSHFR